ncbi:hypothetical protein [Halorhodospira halochloris]|uniref:hypothetical protein n=1 Tax=Halorhodospira halochloris TaxID=1052 RepID=UPI00076F7F0E|nr:hypothetical protein [Halorhodospira halochloris]
MEDAVNPSLEASWRHPWRQDLHSGAADGSEGLFRGALAALRSFRKGRLRLWLVNLSIFAAMP